MYGATSQLAEEVEKAGTPTGVSVTAATMELMSLSLDAAIEKKTIRFNGKTVEICLLARATIDKHRERLGDPFSGLQFRTVPIQASQRLNAVRPNLGGTSGSVRSFGGSGFSDRGSVLSNSANRSPEDILKQRRKFLKSKVEAKHKLSQSMASSFSNEDQAAELSLAVLEERYSRRRFRWLLLEFADVESEAEFMVFARRATRSVRIASKFATLGVILLVIFLIAIQHTTIPIVPGTLFLLSVVSAVGDTVVSLRARDDVRRQRPEFPIRIQVIIQHLTAVLFFVASGFMPLGASVATNDITWQHGIMTALIALGNVGVVSSAFLSAMNILALVPAPAYFAWPGFLRQMQLLFLVQSNAAIIFYLVIAEKQLRRQFVERQIGDYLEGVQAKKTAEQSELLKSVVPSHVIDELIVWLRSEMALSDTIVKRFPSVCVAFVKLSSESGDLLESEAMASRHEPGSPSSKVQSIQNSSFGTSDSSIPRITSFHVVSRLSTFEESVPTDPSTSSINPGSSNGEAQNVDYDLLWLRRAHVEVDAVLARYDAIDKIKTIGDIVMIAGPFREKQFTAADAAEQMMCAISQLRKVATVQGGVHVGEVVGAVLGTNRLCFDIFGDVVNTASRCMTGGSRSDVILSEDFCGLLGVAAVVARTSFTTGSRAGTSVSAEDDNLSFASQRSDLLAKEIAEDTPNDPMVASPSLLASHTVPCAKNLQMASFSRLSVSSSAAAANT